MEAPPSSYSLSPASQSSITFYDFLDKMRNPASLDLVRAIKSFIVSFSFYTANPENDGKRVQEFFSTMEATIIEHPLWAGATNEEVDCAMELAEKELQKINAFKAPREKLLCIMSCCRVINNLLLNASISENHALGGADDFLPVLIYVTIKANPPQLHSNLKFIQLYRRQAKLVSEAAYYFTNLVSAKSFIIDLNAKSLSMDEIEFEQSMQSARLANNKSQVEPSSISYGMTDLGAETGPGTSTSMDDVETNMNGTLHYPYMEAEAGELTVKDVERLLSLYKDVVTKYTSLCSAVRRISESGMVPSHPIFRGTSAFSSQVEGQPEGTDVSVDVKEEEQSRKQICK
ncbi:vacuolar protein sorting-associated protein 9A isoform X4 [Hevea brasiliensis]|uniref:vacuolar protein sorting-associated protein 9A isoform X4 n=1 Tax=Hevea brasiliensis TaxID=3981 RepID=UPI0025E917ED|nr:vacuolar protein sorting-associated protein 9A isoform X4 [Hevea brasiliensis]